MLAENLRAEVHLQREDWNLVLVLRGFGSGGEAGCSKNGGSRQMTNDYDPMNQIIINKFHQKVASMLSMNACM